MAHKLTAPQQSKLLLDFTKWSGGLSPQELEVEKIQLLLKDKQLPKGVDPVAATDFLSTYVTESAGAPVMFKEVRLRDLAAAVADYFGSSKYKIYIDFSRNAVLDPVKHNIPAIIKLPTPDQPLRGSTKLWVAVYDAELTEDAMPAIVIPDEYKVDEAHQNVYKIGFRHGFTNSSKIDTSGMLISAHADVYHAGYAAGKAAAKPISEGGTKCIPETATIIADLKERMIAEKASAAELTEVFSKIEELESNQFLMARPSTLRQAIEDEILLEGKKKKKKHAKRGGAVVRGFAYGFSGYPAGYGGMTNVGAGDSGGDGGGDGGGGE